MVCRSQNCHFDLILSLDYWQFGLLEMPLDSLKVVLMEFGQPELDNVGMITVAGARLIWDYFVTNQRSFCSSNQDPFFRFQIEKLNVFH